MLLPSALCPKRPSSCPLPSLFSPPASPPPPQSALFATCRALQSMLASPPPPQPAQLPTPPMRNAPLPSPMRLRLRSSKPAASPAAQKHAAAPAHYTNPLPTAAPPRKRIVLRQPPPPLPPRGVNKRRREEEEEEDDEEAEARRPAQHHHQPSYSHRASASASASPPSTPKRARVAPAILPLGLARGDFERLVDAHQYSSSPPCAPAERRGEEEEDEGRERRGGGEQEDEGRERRELEDAGRERRDAEWTDEDDARLVELVLRKLRLSAREWEECARSLGRGGGGGSVGRRWGGIVERGGVGLREREREGGGTWR